MWKLNPFEFFLLLKQRISMKIIYLTFIGGFLQTPTHNSKNYSLKDDNTILKLIQYLRYLKINIDKQN